MKWEDLKRIFYFLKKMRSTFVRDPTLRKIPYSSSRLISLKTFSLIFITSICHYELFALKSKQIYWTVLWPSNISNMNLFFIILLLFTVGAARDVLPLTLISLNFSSQVFFVSKDQFASEMVSTYDFLLLIVYFRR